MKTIKIIFLPLVTIVTMAGIFSLILFPLEQRFGFDIPGIEISDTGVTIWGIDLTKYEKVLLFSPEIIVAMMILFQAIFPNKITPGEELN